MEGDGDIAEVDRQNRLALEREVAHVGRTLGPRAARRARRILTRAVDDRRRELVEQRLRELARAREDEDPDGW